MPILTPEERVGSTMAGKYRLESIIATGGMATVFGGVHAWTEREVAIKKILNYEHARDPEIVRRFLQEARSAAQLKHPNVVDVLDMGEDSDGTVYLVLERLHGETLKARMKRGTLTLREVSTLLLPVMRAVASAHAKKVVHRDLKPDNIFLASAEGGPVVPKLLDFGIAKVVTSDSGSTRTGLMVGTPAYMSPEQVRGERHVGPRADVWSMGVVLHAALTGHVPFEGETSAAVLARVITERAQSILTIAPTLKASLAAVIDRSLIFEQEARFVDMGEMVTALEAALDGPTEPRVAPPVSRAPLPAPVTPSIAMPETPTMQLADKDLEQATQPGPSDASAAMLPATPFAWAPVPTATAEPSPPPSRLPWVIGAVVALTLAIVGVGFGLMGQSEPTARPLAPTPARAAPPETIAAPTIPTPPPSIVIADPVVADPFVADPVVVDPVIAPAASADAGVAAVATEPPSTTTTVARTPRAPASTSSSSSTRPLRTPQRGTGGALILH